MADRLRRKYDITIEIGGDEWEDAQNEIERVLQHITEHGPECSLVSGGCSTSAIVTILFNPAMTHERYFEELKRRQETP